MKQSQFEAYQENSGNKLAEFYEYLTLYSKVKDDQLKEQIKQGLLTIVKTENLEVIDFTNPELIPTTLPVLLSKIEEQTYQFEVKPEMHFTEPGWHEWINQYELVVKKGDKTSSFHLNQEIKFEPIEKKFGSKSKTIWEMKRGNMSVR